VCSRAYPLHRDHCSPYQTLIGHLRISPPPPFGLFPFLNTSSPPRDPYTSVSLVSLAHRPRSSFFDYTARYGSVREENRTTLRESLSLPHSSDNKAFFDTLVDTLELTHLLDLTFISLSNGQMRRARILKALIGRPELLLLDEPLSNHPRIHPCYTRI
jgi:ABC-type sugar transport system ATPase subunit